MKLQTLLLKFEEAMDYERLDEAERLMGVIQTSFPEQDTSALVERVNHLRSDVAQQERDAAEARAEEAAKRAHIQRARESLSCSRCGSVRLVRDLPTVGRGRDRDRRLVVSHVGAPDAWVNNEVTLLPFEATACLDCGHLSFSLSPPSTAKLEKAVQDAKR